MDRLIKSNLDFEFADKIISGKWKWVPLTPEQRAAGRVNAPKPASQYRGARRNAREQRKNPSRGTGYLGSIRLNRSQHWLYAADYCEARDLSQSSREVV